MTKEELYNLCEEKVEYHKELNKGKSKNENYIPSLNLDDIIIKVLVKKTMFWKYIKKEEVMV